jgi:hypothetical protein
MNRYFIQQYGEVLAHHIYCMIQGHENWIIDA